jgi:hypothetical protein
MVLAIAALAGALGLAAGWLIGAGIARWSVRKERAGKIVAAAVVVVLACVGVWQASAVRTVPRSAADARAHDYSLAALWQGVILWTCGVNALGAVVGLRRRIGRDCRFADFDLSAPDPCSQPTAETVESII